MTKTQDRQETWATSTPCRNAIIRQVCGSLMFAAFVLPAGADEPTCPADFRLHYQGFCINKADEIADDPEKGVRSAPLIFNESIGHDGLEKVGYKFSNMADGWFCKDLYVDFTESRIPPPAAMALGSESCGRSASDVAGIVAARQTALKTCQAQTSGCRIIIELTK